MKHHAGSALRRRGSMRRSNATLKAAAQSSLHHRVERAAQAIANLIEGEQPGQTDLLLGVADRAAVNGDVSLDNNGARSTGSNRVLANLSVNSPLGMGDQLQLTALKTQGSDYQRVGFTLPVGYDGLRAGAHATHLSYGLVGDFASMGSNGSSLSTGLDVSYPLLRSQPTNINLMANYEQKRFDNNNLSGSVSHYNIDVYSIGVNANQLDNWNGGGMSNASATLTTGQVNLDGSANQSTDTNGPATAGNFAKLSLSLSRLQKLDTTLSAYVAVNMQMANKNLDSSERMSVSGSSGVWGHPAGELMGSNATLVKFELARPLPSYEGLQHNWFTFYDFGQASAQVPVSDADNRRSISDVGFGWSGNYQGMFFKAQVAHRIQDAAPTSEPYSRNKFLLQVGYSY